jgi:hypothetical protein
VECKSEPTVAWERCAESLDQFGEWAGGRRESADQTGRKGRGDFGHGLLVYHALGPKSLLRSQGTSTASSLLTRVLESGTMGVPKNMAASDEPDGGSSIAEAFTQTWLI